MKYGGLFLFDCNFDVKDFSIHSQFYTELLQWWSEFCEDFSSNKYWNNVIWNNKKEIRVNGSPVFYKNYFNSDFFYVSDLLLPPQGFGLEAKTRGGIVVYPAYTYIECVKYWCSMRINPDLKN